LNVSDVDPEQSADNLLARWDSARGRNKSQAADKEFRIWLMRTVPGLLEAMGPGLDNDQAHCTGVAVTIERCVSLGRLDDAFTLAEWLVDAYVPRGGDLSRQTILGTTAFCSDVGQAPELNERAVRLLRRVVDAAPRNGGMEMEWAVCKALMDLSTLYTVGSALTDSRHRTPVGIDVCDEIIARWEASRDSWLRLNVAGAMLNKAMSLLELGDELAARPQYARLIESFASDGNDGKMGRRLYIARHALEILDTLRFPDPEFKTEYFEAQRRRARRRFHFGAGRDASEHIRAAYQLHRATADFVRHTACVGEPWVLLLRNFDLMETSIVTTSPPDWASAEGESEVYGKTIYFRAGLSLMNQLIKMANVVQVANTQAAALEIDMPTMLAHGRKWTPRILYLPDSGWLDTVRVLISLAEHIVVWAHEKTPALLQELALITELGRRQDTSVLLEEQWGRRMTYAGFDPMPPKRGVLSSGDPALTGFPIVIRAQDADPDRARPSDRRSIRDEISSVTTFGEPSENPVVAGFLNIMRAEEARQVNLEGSPFLHQIMSKITSAQQCPMEERVARIRHRIDAPQAH
jgi:hypothetical protein